MTTPDRRHDDVSLGEIARGMDDMRKQLAELLREIRRDFVRKDVYEVAHEVLVRDLENFRREVRAELEEERTERKAQQAATRANRLLALSGLVFPVLTSVITALLVAKVLPT